MPEALGDEDGLARVLREQQRPRPAPRRLERQRHEGVEEFGGAEPRARRQQLLVVARVAGGGGREERPALAADDERVPRGGRERVDVQRRARPRSADEEPPVRRRRRVVGKEAAVFDDRGRGVVRRERFDDVAVEDGERTTVVVRVGVREVLRERERDGRAIVDAQRCSAQRGGERLRLPRVARSPAALRAGNHARSWNAAPADEFVVELGRGDRRGANPLDRGRRCAVRHRTSIPRRGRLHDVHTFADTLNFTARALVKNWPNY